MSAPPDARAAHQVAAAWWSRLGDVRPVGDPGLINQTWLLGEPSAAVLQWVNPIFAPHVHLDIAAVTARLAGLGLATPVLLPAEDGRLWVTAEAGCWRVLSFVPGRTVHRILRPQQARAAGELVGRFHSAVHGWQYDFAHVRAGAHDTLRHMAVLSEALDEAAGHPLADAARALGGEVLERWSRWSGSLDLPLRGVPRRPQDQQPALRRGSR